MKPAHIPENASLLVDMDRRLKARNAALAIITTPTANCYRNGMSPEAYRRMQQTLAALCASNGIPYFNYTGDKRFSDSDFWDSDHLTLEGAKKFSVILREEVESRLIAPRNAGSDAAWSKGKGRIPAQ
jgi:lysophospholipase L1-like esterase